MYFSLRIFFTMKNKLSRRICEETSSDSTLNEEGNVIDQKYFEPRMRKGEERIKVLVMIIIRFFLKMILKLTKKL